MSKTGLFSATYANAPQFALKKLNIFTAASNLRPLHAPPDGSGRPRAPRAANRCDRPLHTLPRRAGLYPRNRSSLQ
jgi:hypothetical protein